MRIFLFAIASTQKTKFTCQRYEILMTPASTPLFTPKPVDSRDLRHLLADFVDLWNTCLLLPVDFETSFG